MSHYSRKKGDEERIENPFLEKARYLERQASSLRRERGYRTSVGHSITPEEIGEMYEEAGELRAKAKDFVAAEEDYIQAKRYGFPYDEGRKKSIDKKINQLLLDKRNRVFLERMKEKQFWGSRVNAVISIAILSVSLFFVSAGITGFAVLGLAENNLRNIGICFFACGLIMAFVYLKCKDKKKKKK